MSKATSFNHPNPSQYQLEQWAAMLLLTLLVFAALALAILAFVIPAPLFLVMSPLILLLGSPVLRVLITTPPLKVEAEGLRLMPLFGGERFIKWDEIEAIAPYPLLPSASQEVTRRWMVGRKQYRAAEGLMLFVPSLPIMYRFASFFQQNGRAFIAITNRNHENYQDLKDLIESKVVNNS